jgi:hypothetical protein
MRWEFPHLFNWLGMRGVALLLVGLFSLTAAAQQRAVISDPDGYVNVRASGNVSAKVVTIVKANEPFTFEWEPGSDWCRVKSSGGKSGWMHYSRIKLHFTDADLPSTEPDPAGLSEIDEAAKSRGLDYAAVTRAAARGDETALKQFFELGEALDGAAAESHYGMPTTVCHLLGDQKFAQFLERQPSDFRVLVRNEVLSDFIRLPSSEDYLRRHFPAAAAILFRQEVSWPSPDGRYIVRKTFTDKPLEDSKVLRAEVVEAQSGAVVADLSADDIGTGSDREGSVLWSPDSERFANLSMDLTRFAGNLFSKPPPRPQRKQTVVFQRAGAGFSRVNLPLAEAPGSKEDPRLKRAVLGHEHTEPLRWERPNVLLLQRHEYYERLEPTKSEGIEFESIKPFDRLFHIEAVIGADGKGDVKWTEQTER